MPALQKRYQDKKIDSIEEEKGKFHKLVFFAVQPEGGVPMVFPITQEKAKGLGVPIKKLGDLKNPTPASGVIWDEVTDKPAHVVGFILYDLHERIVEYIYEGSGNRPSLTKREVRQIKLPRL